MASEPEEGVASPQQVLPRYRWVVMGLFWALTMAWTLVNMSLGVMLPEMGRDLELTPVRAGWLGSVAWLAMALLSLPFGVWLSRPSPLRVMALAGLVAAAFTFLQGWAPNYWFELGARTIFVISFVALRPVMALLIQQWFSSREIATANGITTGTASVAQAAAVGLTPLLMLALAGWRNAFHAFAVLLLALTLLWMALSRENITEEYRARLASQQGTPLRALSRYRVLWLLAFCQVGSALAYAAFFIFWPTFAIAVRGLPLTTAGLLMSLFPIGSIVGSFSAGFLSDHIGLRKPLIWIPGFTLPLAYLGITYLEAVPLLALLLFVIGFCALEVVPIIMTFPYELPDIAPREIAVALGLITTVTTLGASAGPLVTGWLTQALGSLTPALTVAALSAVTLGVLPLFLPETGWRAQRRCRPQAGHPDTA